LIFVGVEAADTDEDATWHSGGPAGSCHSFV
jgi:hypothetical protein